MTMLVEYKPDCECTLGFLSYKKSEEFVISSDCIL